eukprot:756096-Hanusia_phi.AAC.3
MLPKAAAPAAMHTGQKGRPPPPMAALVVSDCWGRVELGRGYFEKSWMGWGTIFPAPVPKLVGTWVVKHRGLCDVSVRGGVTFSDNTGCFYDNI